MQDFRFFPNPDRLRELLEKEINAKYSGYFTGVDIEEFTEEERIEKELLMSQGFLNWDRRDYQKFCQAIDLFPKDNFEAFAGHVGTKTADEVEAYSKVFFE